jgi:serine protease Do
MSVSAFSSEAGSLPERFRSRRHAAMLALVFCAFVGISAPRSAHADTKNLPDFTELVEQVGPSVVNIRTSEKAKVPRGSANMDPNLEEFFRRFGIPMPKRQDPGRTPRDDDEDAPTRRGIGSGFILSADGYVMTNAHVVDGADELLVTLPDKREFKARVVGEDTRTDVAVVKIEATGLPAVKIGDVDRLKVGEWVIAIGSPFGLQNTVTAGIVSAKQRDTGDFLPFIQTDVAINPGNSGGPLINMRGEVVGINSQIYSPSGGYAGISFAIPIDQAMQVAAQLRANGHVIRGRIGVRISAVTKEVAESLGLGKASGALVQGVEPGSPAEKAGIEAGDIVTKVDGKPVEESRDLARMISAIKPGGKTLLQVFRRGTYKDISTGVVEIEQDAAAPDNTEDAPAAPAVKNILGLSVLDLNDAQKRDLKLKGGVRVDAVEGPAARAGLREGDVITLLGNSEIVNVKQFNALVGKLDKSKPVTLLIRRGDWVNYVVIKPAK